MKLSTKGRYAVTAMLDLAINDRKGPVTLTGISLTQSISLSYLEQLFAKLRHAGLVEGVRGPGGGYRLAKRPERISIADIILAVDQQEDINQNGMNSEEYIVGDVSRLWGELSGRLFEFLDAMTLDQFIPQLGIKDITSQQDAESRRMNFMMPPPADLS